MTIKFKRVVRGGVSDLVTHLEPDILECEVKVILGSITTNKASGADGITTELFQILKKDAIKVLHSICQKLWKTAVATRVKKVRFHLFQRKTMPKSSNCCTIALISHASKILKILQARLQQYVN